jgi:hypothetical protein
LCQKGSGKKNFPAGKDAAMQYSTVAPLVVASGLIEIGTKLEKCFEERNGQMTARVLAFVSGKVTPEATFRFEEDLQRITREMNRLLTQLAYNEGEPPNPDALPKHLWFEGGFYRRMNRKTRNQNVATRFGKITLWRFPYRDDETGDRCIFPLQMQLGLVEGATPALADCAAQCMAETGATQRRVLERLKQDHGVSWGTTKLRAFTQAQADRMESFRHTMQVARVLELLQQARISKGKRKPVLAVGRDGITLASQPHGFWEVATAGTVTVYDRSGKRLGTVYLAYPPELGQATMTEQLARLIEDVLQQWTGPLPRLCYVTDAGDAETKFYRTVLRRMVHPRSGERLAWFRIVDYYHAAQRLTTMAEALFGKGTNEGRSWSRRMRKLLKKANGPSRVLHSAAALLGRRELSDDRQKEFNRAYNYIRKRTKCMDYHGYRILQLPIGSGVTEAACKTLFTERLKLSGMRWKKEGAKSVLQLRVILLSGIWTSVRNALLTSHKPELPRPYHQHPETIHAFAP